MKSVEKWIWFASGLTAGLGALTLTLASAPETPLEAITSQSLSEIRVQKSADLDTDPSLNRLSSMERRYRENLSTRPAQRRAMRPKLLNGTLSNEAVESRAN